MRNIAQIIARYGSLIAGIQKRYSTAASLSFGNATYAPTELTRLIQGVLDAVAATAPARAKWLDTVKTARSASAQARPVVRALVAYLRALYGDNTEALADFGLAPAKAGKPKVETKAKALVQSKATRKARNTMGKKQRKSVKGTVVPGAPASSTTTPPR